MPRTKNQPPPDVPDNRMERHQGAVEWMQPVGTWDPERGGIVPLTDEEREELREAGRKAHADRQRRMRNR